MARRYVDSLAGVRLAEEALPAAAAGERPRVLVEVGHRKLRRTTASPTHDDGIYRAASPARSPGWDLGEFEAAIEVWGRVLSRPEPDLALVNVGGVTCPATPAWRSRAGTAPVGGSAPSP